MRGVEGLELVEGVVFPTGIPKGPYFFLLKTRTAVSDSTTDPPVSEWRGGSKGGSPVVFLACGLSPPPRTFEAERAV